MRMRSISALALALAATAAATVVHAVELSEARIYIEYNYTANDLGFHVSLDGEDWKSLTITNPDHEVIFEVEGRAGYEELGMTELFFEGAEPALDEVDLEPGVIAFEVLAIDESGNQTIAEGSFFWPGAGGGDD